MVFYLFIVIFHMGLVYSSNMQLNIIDRTTEPIAIHKIIKVPRQQSKIVQQSKSNDKQELSNNCTFEQFMKTFNKSYQNQIQAQYRQIVFLYNQHKILKHNSDPNKKYEQGINQFTDMNQEQFLAKYAKMMISVPQFQSMGKNQSSKVEQIIEKKLVTADGNNSDNENLIKMIQKLEPRLQFSLSNTTTQKSQYTSKDNKTYIQYTTNTLNIFYKILLPISTKDKQAQIKNNSVVSIDWSDFAGPVSNQGACGACYIFAVLDQISIMNYFYKKTSEYVKLSTQQIVDCGKNQISQGCNGGFLEGAFIYIVQNGVTFDRFYPYRSGKTGSEFPCASKQGNFKIAYFEKLEEGNCNIFKQTLKRKPIPIGIAGYRLQFYKNGTFNNCNNFIDHAVLLVGFSHERGWKIKNSWGDKWGQKGYAYIEDGNNCGICEMGVVATTQQQLASKSNILQYMKTKSQ